MSVVPITSSFQTEAPLHPKAAQLLTEVFARGWADPAKIHEPSRQTALLLHEAKASFAAALGVRADEIYFLGEPPLGFHLGINGLLTPASCLFFSGTDRAPVHAIVHQRTSSHLAAAEYENQNGSPSDVLVYQSINPETGIHKEKPENFLGAVFVDNTAYGVHSHLPSNWSASFWQSRSWQGPAGLGVLAIKNEVNWRNPLPHIDSTKVPQSFSIPLALASAIALENFTKDLLSAHTQTREFKNEIISFLQKNIGDVLIVGLEDESSASLLSVIISGVDSERLINDLNARQIYVDAGSACMSGNMQPSHVLAAMGLPVTGNMRITLHPQTTHEDVAKLLLNLEELVRKQRNIN